MFEYMTAQEAAELWSISVRRVQRLCKENRIEGVLNVNRVWLIPKNAKKPFDKRKKLSVPEYEKIFSASLVDPQNNVELTSDEEKGRYYFAGICDDIRQYRVK